MADTTLIKTQIEPHIRQWLSTVFQDHTFKERDITLPTGGSYKADAVSDDGSIVAAILCSRAKTRTGNENTGGVRKARGDVSMLNALPDTVTTAMVFTDAEFCDLIARRAHRWGAGNMQMLVCQLPDGLDRLLGTVLDNASFEQRAAD